MGPIRLENVAAVIGGELVEGTSIDIVDGLIAGVGLDARDGAEVREFSGLTILPGFIDIHIHGAKGVDVNASDTDGLIEIAKFLAANGVTAWMPTLVPDTDENYARVIAAIDRLMEIQTREPISQAVGVHYEGVFANEKMCGALRPEFFKKFTGSPTTASGTTPPFGHPSLDKEGSPAVTPPKTGRELSELPRLKRGVHMTTFAPEIEGGIELTRELAKSGWIASIGHTRASAETLDDAFAAGARHLTHFFNAMTAMHHRDLGVVGWALANPDVTFDIIADGVHVHPKMLEFASRSKSPALVSLISDSVAPTGLGDGEFEVWGEKITVNDRRTRNERGSIAGSVITMLDAVKQMSSLGFSPADTSHMASGNPAKLLGIEKSQGSIEVGKRADIVALDVDGDLKMTMIGGMTAFSDIE